MRLTDFESRRVDELAPATLASYKTKAGAAATAADAAGDRKTADKRFSGIVKATKKQFDQDAKGMSEGLDDTVRFEIDSENAYNHVMDQFGSVIDWDGDTMVAPRKYWGAIQELALAASGEASEEQGLAEGSEQISEYRDRLLQYVKSLLPNYPEYVLKDWLVPNKGDFSNLPDTDLKNGIMEKLKLAGLTPNTKWQLVPDMKFTMAMFDPMTKQRLIGRAGGHSDLGMGIPRDKERHATQAALAQQQGGVRKEPVLLIKTAKGYELLEGWHRTIQHFARYPDGYVGPAYVAVAQGQQGVAEGKLKINYDSWLSKVPNTINDKMKKVLRVMQDGKVRSRADMLRAAGIDPNPRSPGGVAGMEGTDYYLYKKGLLDVVDIVKGLGSHTRIGLRSQW
jgi:hypothetical protein